METMRALLLEDIHPDAVKILDGQGWSVTSLDGALDEAKLTEALDGVHLLGIRSKTTVTQAVLKAAPDLLAIGAFCIGTNQIDLDAAGEDGVAVFNAPFSNTRSVVELAVAEIIALTRHLTDKSTKLHDGIWDKSAVGSARRCGTMEELLDLADVVTLHVDGRSGNSGLFGEAEFAKMRQGSIFLNLSRGFVVDHEALRTHLVSGHLAGAAVDVFPEEPERRGQTFESTLRGLPNVILTPHIGGSTEEAQQDIGHFVAGKLRDYVLTGGTRLSVNLPELALDRHPDLHRLLYLHRNTPGVLAKMNGTLADHGVNVEGQLLGTSGPTGYVITDVAADVDQDVLDSLNALPETIRIRVA
jgi:D-3-phosphoglycerate dehydrogenase